VPPVAILGLVVTVLFGGCYACVGYYSEGGAGAVAIERERLPAKAWVACQQFVGQRLIAPGSAKYPWDFQSHVSEIGPGRFRAAAYVDAQSGFGALLRKPFVCEVHQDGDRWRLDALAM
jgi:hypothetical protein